MGLLDNILGRKTNDYAERNIEELEKALKDASREATTPEEKKTLEKAKEMQKIVKEKYKEIRSIKDQKTFDLRAHVVGDMAMYAKTYLREPDKQRWSYVFDDRHREVDFKRPENAEDMEYRANILKKIIPDIQKALGDDSDYLFHSTSRSNARGIIEGLSLSSSADRYDGYDASTDGIGRISVADKDGLDWSANYWLHTTNALEPCGVLFVLKENHENDFDKTQHQMDSIDFSKNPEQLQFVLSSPENMESLKQEMSKVGLNPDLVITFDQFLELELQKNQEHSIQQSKEIDLEKIIEGIEDPDRKYQARQVLLKLEIQGPEKIDVKQFNFEKDSAEKIQLTLQGQIEFGKENTECYKDLSDKQIKKLRSIQLLQQKHPDKISIQDVIEVSQAGDSKSMERALIKIAQREGIEEIPNIQTNKKANDTIQQRPPSLDSIIKSKSIDSKEQDKTEQQRQNNDPTR